MKKSIILIICACLILGCSNIPLEKGEYLVKSIRFHEDYEFHVCKIIKGKPLIVKPFDKNATVWLKPQDIKDKLQIQGIDHYIVDELDMITTEDFQSKLFAKIDSLTNQTHTIGEQLKEALPRLLSAELYHAIKKGRFYRSEYFKREDRPRLKSETDSLFKEVIICKNEVDSLRNAYQSIVADQDAVLLLLQIVK